MEALLHGKLMSVKQIAILHAKRYFKFAVHLPAHCFYFCFITQLLHAFIVFVLLFFNFFVGK